MEAAGAFFCGASGGNVRFFYMNFTKTCGRTLQTGLYTKTVRSIHTTTEGHKEEFFMKKLPAAFVCAALCALSLLACGAPAPGPAAGGAAQLSGTVATNGSTSMQKVMGALIEGFAEVQPGVTVTYDPTGSGSGIEAASNGSADIGLASRPLQDGEKASGLTGTAVAMDGIAIIVNPENPVGDLSLEQIASIATGEITNWSELGGTDAPIALIGREAGSGTRGAFEELTGTEDACRYAQELTSTGAVVTAVSTTPGAAGYASLSALGGEVKAVTVGGVACTEETVLDGSYAVARPFLFVTREGEALSEAAQAFYDFALDPACAGLYTLAGVVPAGR